MTRNRIGWLIAGLLALAATAVAGCGSDDSSSASDGGGGELALVAYSTPQQAYEDAVIPGFQETPDGEGVEFSTSFGASGDQRRAVESGLPADIVAFSLEPDMTKTVEAGLVAKDWSSGEHEGMVTDSVVVLSVRPGNPKDIEGWKDLVRDDVDVITPNPATSGGAKWNIMAAYGSQIEQGKSEQEALDFVKAVLANTSVQDDSARDSLQTFAGGKGDVLIGYENEAIQAQDEDIELEFVIPDETILIENPIAATTDGGEAAQRFVDYTRTEPAQQLFADRGYRPVVKAVLEANRDKFPQPAALFTIEEFGGWDKVETDFFDEENGSIFEIQRELGNPTE
jgi:sulfate/thiosulfate transport system substrate-binding protein